MSKYLNFEEMTNNKIKDIIITNKHNHIIGYIDYYITWKQYVFNSQDCIALSSECLQEIVNKLNELNQQVKSNDSSG